MPGADPAEYAIRLGLWLTARQQNPYRDNTTFVACAPLDRSTSAYMIAESDIEAALDENEQLRKRFAELSDGMTVAVELLDKFTTDTPCTEGGDTCRVHGYARKPCSHPLGRQLVDAWREVQAERQEFQR